MSFDNPNRPAGRRGLGPLATTVIGLIALAAGVVTWLALSDAPDRKGASPTAVSVALAPVAPAPSSAQQTTMPATKPEPAATSTPVPAPTATPPAQQATTPAPDPAATPAATPPAQQTTTPAPAPAATPSPDPAQQATTPAPAPAATPSPDPAQQATTSAPKAEPPAPTTTAALPALPAPDRGLLAPAPDPALLEPSRFGQLPRISRDGRKAWQTYARPFDANDQRPRIAIIIGNLGLSGAATESAIWRLPGAVTLSFSPYARGLDHWIALARAAGHEVLIDLPMEPINFPANDPGPETLLTSLTAEQNRTRLRTLLGRVSGYVGVVNHMGSRFTTSAPHLRPVLTELRDRGLLFVDSRSSLRSVAARTASEVQLPRVINNRFIDSEASRDSIDARLAELERVARVSGYAVGIGQPFPATLDRLQLWTRNIEEKGLALAPVSAMANAQPD